MRLRRAVRARSRIDCSEGASYCVPAEIYSGGRKPQKLGIGGPNVVMHSRVAIRRVEGGGRGLASG
jgi:hypothetical protein